MSHLRPQVVDCVKGWSRCVILEGFDAPEKFVQMLLHLLVCWLLIPSFALSPVFKSRIVEFAGEAARLALVKPIVLKGKLGEVEKGRQRWIRGRPRSLEYQCDGIARLGKRLIFATLVDAVGVPLRAPIVPAPFQSAAPERLLVLL